MIIKSMISITLLNHDHCPKNTRFRLESLSVARLSQVEFSRLKCFSSSFVGRLQWSHALEKWMIKFITCCWKCI